MAIAFLGAATTVDSSGATTRNLTQPTMADGCVVILLASGNLSGPPTATPPTGFNFVARYADGTNTYLDIYWKLISSAATEATVTWTMTYSGTSKGAYHCLSYSGVNTTTPFDVESGQAETGTATSHSTPSITTTNSGDWLISTFIYRLTSGAAWTGGTDTSRENDVTGGTNSIQHFTQDTNGTVAVGSYSRSATSTSASAAVMWIGALQPPAGTAYTDTRTDTSGLTDTRTVSVGFNRTQTDTSGATDSVTTAAGLARSQTDTAGITDSVQTAFVKSDTRTDTAGLTDSVSTVKLTTIPDTETDSAGLTDSVVTDIVHLTYGFSPPGVERRLWPYTKHRLTGRLRIPVSLTLIRTGTSVVQIEDPDPSLFETADAVYLGGHQYRVDIPEATLLSNAGYGSSLVNDMGI